MAKSKQPSASGTFNLGNRVRIKNYAGKLGKVVELRGALGPNGAPVYRVQMNRKPVATFIELLGNQLELVPLSELGQVLARRKAKREVAVHKSHPKGHKEA